MENEILDKEQRDIIANLQKRLFLLVAAGGQMRTAQNLYFRDKGPIRLKDARNAEDRFDNLLKGEIENVKQPGLF